MKRLGAAAALVLVAGCSSVGPTSPIQTTFASPTLTLAPTATAASPSASLPASQVPSLGPDEAKALDLATRYETARAAGNSSQALGPLSDPPQAVIGSLAAFQTGEIAYDASGGTVLVHPTPDPGRPNSLPTSSAHRKPRSRTKRTSPEAISSSSNTRR